MIASKQIAFGIKKKEASEYWGLCFTAEEANSTVAMQAVGSAPAVNLMTSYDGENWEPFYVGTTTINLPNVGDKAYFKAGDVGNTMFATSTSNYTNFVMNKRISANGEVS